MTLHTNFALSVFSLNCVTMRAGIGILSEIKNGVAEKYFIRFWDVVYNYPFQFV